MKWFFALFFFTICSSCFGGEVKSGAWINGLLPLSGFAVKNNGYDSDTSGTHWGVNAHGADDDLQKDLIEDAGIEWVRIDFSWDALTENDPVSGTYGMYLPDQIRQLEDTVCSYNGRGISVLGVLAYTPVYARSACGANDRTCRPEKPNYYSSFVGDMVSRFKGYRRDDGCEIEVNNWEIWNEPDTQKCSFFKAPAPEDTLEAYKNYVFIPGVKAVEYFSQGADNIVGPALSNNLDVTDCSSRDRVDWVTEIVGLFDVGGELENYRLHAFSYHSYSGVQSSNHPDLATIHDVIDACTGCSIEEIWITEAGLQLNVSSANDEKKQFEYIRGDGGPNNIVGLPAGIRAPNAQSNAYADKLFFYHWRDDNHEDIFGLLRPDRQKTASWCAIKETISCFADWNYQEFDHELCDPNDNDAYPDGTEGYVTRANKAYVNAMCASGVKTYDAVGVFHLNKARPWDDDSGQAHHGTKNGDITTDTSGKFGPAIIFDGSGDFITADAVCADMTTNEFSVGGWFYPTATARSYPIAFSDSSDWDRNVLVWSPVGYPSRFGYFDGSVGNKVASTDTSTNNWHQVYLTVTTSNSAKLFVDGKKVLSFTTTVRPATNGKFSIGHRWSGSTHTSSGSFTGKIDEVILYDRALSEQEICEGWHGTWNGSSCS